MAQRNASERARQPRRTRRWRWLPFLARDAVKEIVARLLGRGTRQQEVLRFVHQHAQQGDPESVLSAMDEFGRRKRFLMNVGDEKGLLLDRVILENRAKRVLELGCFVGYSAVRIARHLPVDGKLISVEVNPGNADVARQVVAFAGVSDRVEFRVGDSQAAIPTLEGTFDVVFLDHWKEHYLRDIELIEQHRLLRTGSVVVADNVGPYFGADAYLDHVRKCGRYETTYHPAHIEYSVLEDGVEVSKWKGRSEGA